MNDLGELATALGQDPRGAEIAKILLELLTDADEDARLLVLVKLREASRERRLTLHSPQPSTDAERDS